MLSKRVRFFIPYDFLFNVIEMSFHPFLQALLGRANIETIAVFEFAGCFIDHHGFSAFTLVDALAVYKIIAVAIAWSVYKIQGCDTLHQFTAQIT